MKKQPFFVFLILLISICLDANFNAYGQDKTVSKELMFLVKNTSQISFEAEIEFDKRNYKEASKKFLEILHNKPNDIATLYNLARCYAYMNKPIQAAEVLKFALDAGLNDIQALISDSAWVPLKNNEKINQILNYAKKLQDERGDFFYSECSVAIKCRIRKPNDYDSTKVYPLIIILHGNGGNAESYMPFRNIMGAKNFFFVSPQGPYSRSDNDKNSNAFSWFLFTKDKSLWEKYDPYIADYIVNIIKKVKSQFKISGVYILGHSQGGALAYLTGIRNSELIDGLICFGARCPIEIVSKSDIYNAKKKFPVFIGHGINDPLVSYEEARKATKTLSDYGYNVTLMPFNGGHWLDSTTLHGAKRWVDVIESKKANP